MSSLNPEQYLKGFPLVYCTDFPQISQYFNKDYRKIEFERSAISDTVLTSIEAYNRRIGASSFVFENIKKLKEYPVIITGQQPCLLTGPLYVVYKALTAVILAEKVKGVPVFWNASEDDDIQEVNHIWVMNTSLERIAVRLEAKPFFKTVIRNEDIQYVKDSIKKATPPTEFRDRVLDMIPQGPLTFSEMFSRILSQVFSSYGLIMVEPHIFAEASLPVYEALIRNPTQAVARVNATGDSLEEKGFKRQLYKTEDSCSFYIIVNDERHTVSYDGTFHVNNDTFTEKELLNMLDEHPESFTSTVVSRPLIQDFLFSTLAYCAGPGEISYFAQMRDVYTFFKIPEPYIVPRFGATIVEKKVQKILDKYRIPLTDLRDPDQLTKSMARKDIQEFFDRRKGVILTSVQELVDYMTSVDGNLKKTGDATKTRVFKALESLEEKTSSTLKKQNTIMEEQIVKASYNIYPNRMLQERVLNVFQYLIRYNTLITTLYTELGNAQPGEHVLVYPGD